VIDNRPGAGGNLASELLIKADPDGYTIMLTTVGSLAINPHMPGGTSFNPLKDFSMVSQGVTFSNILVVKADSKINSLQDYVALGKNKNAFVSFGSSGNGSTGHLAGELLKARSGMSAEHINYKGGGPAMTDLLGGNITAIFASTPTAVPLLNAGKIKAIAITSPKRLAALPDVPTVAEQGYSGYQALNWYAFIAPPKVPPEIIQKLNQAIVATLKDPETVAKLRNVDLEPAPSTPQELYAFAKSENEMWGKIIKSINLSER
jgi:tripartite-type tricarboxylate transporter receptor subunit TctC